MLEELTCDWTCAVQSVFTPSTQPRVALTVRDAVRRGRFLFAWYHRRVEAERILGDILHINILVDVQQMLVQIIHDWRSTHDKALGPHRGTVRHM